MKQKKAKLFVWCSLLLFLLSAAFPCFAAGSIDTKEPVTLTISYQNEKNPLVGAEFALYQVAEVDAYGECKTTETFEAYPVQMDGKKADWKTLALTLEGYVLRDKIVPLDTGKTNSQGLLCFPTGTKQLTSGLYLVLSHRHRQGKLRYDAAPFLVLLPSHSKTENTWQYDAAVQVKYESQVISSGSGGETESSGRPGFSDSSVKTFSIRVMKRWQDPGQESMRPEKITVQLLCDGTVYDKAELNEENSWRYSWEDLSDAFYWTAAEDELENYLTELEREGNVIVITNTHLESILEGLVPGEKNQAPADGQLPQTGQLWWPVPCLLCVGLALILVGMLIKKDRKDEE